MMIASVFDAATLAATKLNATVKLDFIRGQPLKGPCMNNVYAMRRANGDWFVLEKEGRLRMPLFQSSHDALMARVRNFGMLLFQPVMLDAQSMKEITPAGEARVDFCMVDDPFASLKRSHKLDPSELASLVETLAQVQPVTNNGAAGQVSAEPLDRQGEWWN